MGATDQTTVRRATAAFGAPMASAVGNPQSIGDAPDRHQRRSSSTLLPATPPGPDGSAPGGLASGPSGGEDRCMTADVPGRRVDPEQLRAVFVNATPATSIYNT